MIWLLTLKVNWRRRIDCEIRFRCWDDPQQRNQDCQRDSDQDVDSSAPGRVDQHRDQGCKNARCAEGDPQRISGGRGVEENLYRCQRQDRRGRQGHLQGGECQAGNLTGTHELSISSFAESSADFFHLAQGANDSEGNSRTRQGDQRDEAQDYRDTFWCGGGQLRPWLALWLLEWIVRLWVRHFSPRRLDGRGLSASRP